MHDQKHKPNHFPLARQISIDLHAHDQQHYFQNYRKKYRKSKNANYTNSINSIETKRSTENILKRKQVGSYRKGFSINAIESLNMHTERPPIINQFPKRHSQMKPIHFNLKNRSEKLHTISQKGLDYKQKKLKDCIELMKGVLQQIKNEKTCRKIIKSTSSNDLQQEKIVKQKVAVAGKEEPTKFQKYINNITKYKNDNKILIVKKGKSRHNLHQNMMSNHLLRPERFDLAKKKTEVSNREQSMISFNISNTQDQKQNERYQLQSRSKRMKSQISEIECSSIAKINQSSFISDFGKKSLMKNILEENLSILNKEKDTSQSKKGGRMKNSKLLKHIFPNDFF